MLTLKTLLSSFFITMLAELTVTWLWKIREKNEWYVIFLVNLITNPVLVMIRIWGYYLLSPEVLQGMILFLEILILFLEGFLYSRRLYTCRHPYLLSAAVNAASFGTGLILNLIHTF